MLYLFVVRGDYKISSSNYKTLRTFAKTKRAPPMIPPQRFRFDARYGAARRGGVETDLTGNYDGDMYFTLMNLLHTDCI